MRKILNHEKKDYEVFQTEYFKRRLNLLIEQEPRLEELIFLGLKADLSKTRLDIIPGLSGWAKCRLPSPSQSQGKRGGFRLIFLFYRVRQTIYLGELYYKRDQADIRPDQAKELISLAKTIKTFKGANDEKTQAFKRSGRGTRREQGAPHEG